MNIRENYTVDIAGHKRILPLCSVGSNTEIAAFIMFGDVEITKISACELLKKSPKFDILLTAESKGIPLCYEMARQSGKNYIVARKSEKLYMKNSISVNVKSITTRQMQKLYLSESEFSELENKNILIVDDVISTGQSVLALEKLVEYAHGAVAGKVCVLAEGEAANRKDIIFLSALPVFKK